MNKSMIGANTACLADYSLYDAIARIKEFGFETIELLAFDGAKHSIGNLAGFWFGQMTGAERKKLKGGVKDFKYLSTHAPFIETPLITPNPGVKEKSVRQVREAIEATAFLGGGVTVVHANCPPSFGLQEIWQEMLDTFRELGNFAGKYKVKIGIETGLPSSIEDFCKLILEIDHPSVGANIDVGHIFASVDRKIWGTEEGIETFNRNLMQSVKVLKEKLYHFHLHDVRKTDFRDHRTLGTGIIDFKSLFTYLNEISYDGLLVFELEEHEKEKAILESRKYLEGVWPV